MSNEHIVPQVAAALACINDDDLDIFVNTGYGIPPTNALLGGTVYYSSDMWIAAINDKPICGGENCDKATRAVIQAVKAARYAAEVILWHYADDLPEYLQPLARTPPADFPWPEILVTVQFDPDSCI